MTVRIRTWGRAIGLALLVMVTMFATSQPVHAENKINCASLEKCYGYDEMNEFLYAAWGLVNEFVAANYQPRLFDVHLRYVAHGESGDEGCQNDSGSTRFTDRSYEYCAADGTVYIGQDEIWQFYSSIGDVAAVVGLAHEYGHALQHSHGVQEARSPAQSVRLEDQADCVGGAWFAWADAKGMVEYPDDLRDLTGLLHLIGSSEDDPNRDHGTTAERTAALRVGTTGGLDACNAFAPATPLHTHNEAAVWAAMLERLRRSNPGLEQLHRASPSGFPHFSALF